MFTATEVTEPWCFRPSAVMLKTSLWELRLMLILSVHHRDNTHEMPDEEVHWISAAERADSIGVDVINTSLGYYDFDDSRYNYLYEDMDGQTTYISRGAQFAAEKGIMVVVSAE